MSKLLAAMSLRMRLTLLVGVLALVITVDQGLEIARERDESLAQMQARAIQIAVAGASDQSAAIVNTQALLNLLAEIPLGAGEECVARLKQVHAASPALGSIFIAPLDGITTCSSVTGQDGTDISKRAYFLTMLETKSAVTSDYNIGLATKRPRHRSGRADDAGGQTGRRHLRAAGCVLDEPDRGKRRGRVRCRYDPHRPYRNRHRGGARSGRVDRPDRGGQSAIGGRPCGADRRPRDHVPRW